MSSPFPFSIFTDPPPSGLLLLSLQLWLRFFISSSYLTLNSRISILLLLLPSSQILNAPSTCKISMDLSPSPQRVSMDGNLIQDYKFKYSTAFQDPFLKIVSAGGATKIFSTINFLLKVCSFVSLWVVTLIWSMPHICSFLWVIIELHIFVDCLNLLCFYFGHWWFVAWSLENVVLLHCEFDSGIWVAPVVFHIVLSTVWLERNFKKLQERERNCQNWNSS